MQTVLRKSRQFYENLDSSMKIQTVLRKIQQIYAKINLQQTIMDPCLTVQNEKIALELKYLLSLPEQTSEEQSLSALNRLYPFTHYPLAKLPPVQLQEYSPGEVITLDLKELLHSYSLVIILGKCRIQKNIYYTDEQKFIEAAIKDKLVFDLDQGNTELRALYRVTLLKIHNVWFKRARTAEENRVKTYIRQKLISLPFFAKLDFQEFQKICEVARLHTIGPKEVLIQEFAVPYHMYIVTEGELVFQKKVDLAKEKGVWDQFQQTMQKREPLCEELFQYLIREPSAKTQCFTVNFQIKSVGAGTILCGAETLNETPLAYSILSSLKTKYISIKYPDLYVLHQPRLADIRTWPGIDIDKRQLRKQYYYERNWSLYKEYLTQDQQLQQMEAQSFYDLLRKDVDMSLKKYTFCSNKIGEGYIIDSPAAKIVRIKEIIGQQT